MIQIKKKVETLDAVQFNGKNFDEIDAFLGTRVATLPGKTTTIQVNAIGGPTPVAIGDYVAKNDKGSVRVITAAMFQSYETVKEPLPVKSKGE